MKFIKILLWILIIFTLPECDQNKSSKEKIILGEKIYLKNCNSCHSSNSAPDLTDHKLELFKILNQIKYGGEGMPSFIGLLTDIEIENVGYFIFNKF